MPINTSPVFPGVMQAWPTSGAGAGFIEFAAGQGTTLATLCTAHATYGSRLRFLRLTTSDPATTNYLTIQLYASNGTTIVGNNAIPIVPLSGWDGTVPTQWLLSPAYWPGIEAEDYALWLPPGTIVKMNQLANVATSKVTRIFGHIEDLVQPS